MGELRKRGGGGENLYLCRTPWLHHLQQELQPPIYKLFRTFHLSLNENLKESIYSYVRSYNRLYIIYKLFRTFHLSLYENLKESHYCYNRSYSSLNLTPDYKLSIQVRVNLEKSLAFLGGGGGVDLLTEVYFNLDNNLWCKYSIFFYYFPQQPDFFLKIIHHHPRQFYYKYALPRAQPFTCRCRLTHRCNRYSASSDKITCVSIKSLWGTHQIF